MSAVQQPFSLSESFPSLYLARMRLEDLAEVQVIENSVYISPWTRGNFLDSLYSGYDTWTLRDASHAVAGYFLMMAAVDEVHLLNITVRSDLHGQGVGQMLLDHIATIAREKGMTSVLLEVRPSNKRALMVYERYGFVQIGLRKNYYPSLDNTREDAIVMRLKL